MLDGVAKKVENRISKNWIADEFNKNVAINIFHTVVYSNINMFFSNSVISALLFK
ncbi:hypothetical protein [uncultured Gilliamella sp.]|uniref:hypothetical protein n=1 Tax=uncultured Gilliamella sp. TaxID=1193505 RepID=UPI0025D70C8D|nr:hypothetical protein [uncultured Gilliamella sp.]